MSQYVYVIEELDTPDQTAPEEVTVNGSENASNIFNYSLVNNNIPNVALGPPVTVDNNTQSLELSSREIGPGSLIVATAQENGEIAEDKQVVARKKVDLSEFLTESTPKTSRDIRIWPQYRWHCFLCSQSCDYYKLLTNHLRDCHSITDAEDIRYRCSDCGRVIQEYHLFLNHVRQLHHPLLRTSCDVCSFTYEKSNMLAKHRETAHGQQSNLRPIVHHCSQCELVFPSKQALEQHCKHHIWVCMLTKNDGNICNQQFDDGKEFYNHKINHVALDLPFKCSHCDARFQTPHGCRQHSNKHLTNKTAKIIQCKFCPYISSSDQMYLDHLQNAHSSKESFKTTSKKSCNKCGKTFTSSCPMSKHTQFACLRRSLANRIPSKKTNNK